MSSLSAQITEVAPPPRPTGVLVRTETVQSASVLTKTSDSRAQLQAERRCAVRAERRLRRRWAVGGVAVLGASFGCTVAILVVLR